MSKDSLQSLEVELSGLTKKLEIVKHEKALAGSLLKSGEKDVNTFTVSVEHHRKNLIHMRGPADIVNIEEWTKTKVLHKEAKENLVTAKQQVSQACKAIVKMDGMAITLAVEIEAIKKALDGYGKIEPFPSKKLS